MPKKPPRTILVIDDDPGTLRLLEKWLKVAGYNVITSLGGEAGFKSAKDHLPDLILLDVMIPDLSGAEVTKKLKTDPSTDKIPIIFITVTISKKQDKLEKKLVIDGKAYDAFAKPLFQPKLLSVIKKHLKKTPKSKV